MLPGMSGRFALLALTLALAAAPAVAKDAAPKEAPGKSKDKAGKSAAEAPAKPEPVSIANVERKYLERAAISGADKACNLFTEPERLALKSGLYQTEGELLRAGYSLDRLTEMSDDVRAHAKALGCEHPDVVAVAGTIRSSYRSFSKTTFLEYHAGRSSWAASRSEHDKWAVSQDDKATGIRFGIRRFDKPDDLRLAITLPADGYAPSAVKMFLRDPTKAADPWFGTLFGASAALQPPPRSVATPMWAGALKDEVDASENDVYAFYFSPAAITRIEALDPREVVQIELTPSPMDKDAKPVRANFEIGDIRAARAFVMIPTPVYTPPPAEKAAPKSGH